MMNKNYNRIREADGQSKAQHEAKQSVAECWVRGSSRFQARVSGRQMSDVETQPLSPVITGLKSWTNANPALAKPRTGLYSDHPLRGFDPSFFQHYSHPIALVISNNVCSLFEIKEPNLVISVSIVGSSV
jgi:hypothetical protein